MAVLQHLIPDAGQLVFPQVPVEGLVIYEDEHVLIDGLGDTICLPGYDKQSPSIGCPVA